MKSNSKFDINDILSKLLDLSENCIYKNLRTLKSKGIIERIGSNKKAYWKILNLEETKR